MDALHTWDIGYSESTFHSKYGSLPKFKTQELFTSFLVKILSLKKTVSSPHIQISHSQIYDPHPSSLWLIWHTLPTLPIMLSITDFTATCPRNINHHMLGQRNSKHLPLKNQRAWKIKQPLHSSTWSKAKLWAKTEPFSTEHNLSAFLPMFRVRLQTNIIATKLKISLQTSLDVKKF